MTANGAGNDYLSSAMKRVSFPSYSALFLLSVLPHEEQCAVPVSPLLALLKGKLVRAELLPRRARTGAAAGERTRAVTVARGGRRRAEE